MALKDIPRLKTVVAASLLLLPGANILAEDFKKNVTPIQQEANGKISHLTTQDGAICYGNHCNSIGYIQGPEKQEAITRMNAISQILLLKEEYTIIISLHAGGNSGYTDENISALQNAMEEIEAFTSDINEEEEYLSEEDTTAFNTLLNTYEGAYLNVVGIDSDLQSASSLPYENNEQLADWLDWLPGTPWEEGENNNSSLPTPFRYASSEDDNTTTNPCHYDISRYGC